jgi:PilZ domain
LRFKAIAQQYQRRFPRYKFESNVNISVLRGDTPTMVEGLCRVLSEGGAALYSDEKLGMHEILYVEIQLPHRELRLPAAVRNQQGQQYGVEFLALAKPERELLRSTFTSLPQVG